MIYTIISDHSGKKQPISLRLPQACEFLKAAAKKWKHHEGKSSFCLFQEAIIASKSPSTHYHAAFFRLLQRSRAWSLDFRQRADAKGEIEANLDGFAHRLMGWPNTHESNIISDSMAIGRSNLQSFRLIQVGRPKNFGLN